MDSSRTFKWVSIVCKLYLNIKYPLEISVKILTPNIPLSDVVHTGQGCPSDAVENQLPHFADEIGGKGKIG